jgi:transcriptional regulator with XRE-family HTH domain
MSGREDLYKDIDRNIAANLRAHREAGGISQEELAQQMADRGFGFGQATIWKIESGQRPVRASELIALADSLGVLLPTTLTREPDATRYTIQLEHANQSAGDAYAELKEAAAAYLEAQFQLVYAAREAHDAGLTVTELHTSWLSTPPEEAVIEARVEAGHETERSEQDSNEVNKILDALRSNGYEPTLRIEDITYDGGRPLPAWSPEEDG